MKRLAITTFVLLLAGAAFIGASAQNAPAGNAPATNAPTNGQGRAGRAPRPDNPNGPNINNSRPNCCDYKVRPPIFFHEDWTQTPPVTPITQHEVVSPNLILTLWGPGKEGIRRSHHTPLPVDDPYYTFSGPAKGNWAVTLRDKANYVDLTGVAKLKWRINESGLRALHVIVRLANGKWYVSEQSDGPTSDWREREFNFRDFTWQSFEPNSVVEMGPAGKIDLSKVDEVGYTDLMTGGDVSGCPSGCAASRLDWIEVQGWPVPRDGSPGPAH